MAKSVTVSGLSSGVGFTVAIPTADTWLTHTVSGSTVSFSAAAYASSSANRSTTVTITESDGATATIAVTQYKKSVVTLSPTSLAFDASGN